MDKNSEVITIVSGLPRSGTSMMMKMLEAGGMLVLTDHIRAADADNPKGYYEFERVKQIACDQSWLPEARGKAVKIISELLKHLPPDYDYKVIFMRRQIEETLASQRQMLIRRGETTNKAGDKRLAELFRRHLVWLDSRLQKQANTGLVYVDYAEVIANPAGQAKRINQFLHHRLDAEAMAGVVDPLLYRQRR
ncbi:MAG: sulfotransferase domain-containing protein [bacterium]